MLQCSKYAYFFYKKEMPRIIPVPIFANQIQLFAAYSEFLCSSHVDEAEDPFGQVGPRSFSFGIFFECVGNRNSTEKRNSNC